MSYWTQWEDDRKRDKPLETTTDGARQGWRDLQILFYSGAALGGDSLYKLIGGDETSLRWTKDILDQHQKELKNTPRITSDQVIVEGDPKRP